MRANTPSSEEIKKELADNNRVLECARRHGTVGDTTRMKICYLLRHYPELPVSQVAKLVGISISAASRSLQKLQEIDVVKSRKEMQTVYYALKDNDFTRTLLAEMTHPKGHHV